MIDTRKLPVFRGYTVDFKLNEFRRLEYGKVPEFISFQSPKGKKLLKALRKETYMNLLTKDILEKLPPLYSQEEVKDPMVICKFFYPDFSWTWYAIEYDGDDTFYGLVDGNERELGYFSLKELMFSKGALGLPIERDLFFKPCRLSDVMSR